MCDEIVGWHRQDGRRIGLGFASGVVDRFVDSGFCVWILNGR
jgi:hypothetical protein